MKKRIIITIISILIFITADQLIKIFMVDKNIQVIPGILSFDYIKNYGIAFGAKYKMNAIIVANLFLIITLIYIIYKNFNNKSLVYPLTIVLSGGISNLFDRIIYGYVIDYISIDFFKFPKFNLADIAIILGILFLIVQAGKIICEKSN